jgi:THO complex subunit 1 transcription elongation factor
MITSKLTVTHDLEFRGTLQRFLTQIMPLTHPTGVNLLGKFNDTNTTGISTQKEVRESQTSISDEYAGPSQSDERVRTSSQQQFSVSEFKSYRNFWSLQKYLNNPFLVSRLAVTHAITIDI